MPICKTSVLFTKYIFHFLQDYMIIAANFQVLSTFGINNLGITTFWIFAWYKKNY